MNTTDIQKRERYYRLMWEYLEVAERKRDWKLSEDIPWNQIDPGRNSSEKAICLETYCAEEMYLPDYSAHGANIAREIFGAAWFQARWSYEESRHALVFREYLLRSGMRSSAQFDALECEVFRRAWTPPFETIRLMACYGALQEGATYLAYRTQKRKAEEEGDLALSSVFALIASDEAAHAGFYRKAIEIELDTDRCATVADFARALATFKMPGEGLIADYHKRLKIGGGGISARAFVQEVVLPSLRSLGITSDELRTARHESAA